MKLLVAFHCNSKSIIYFLYCLCNDARRYVTSIAKLGFFYNYNFNDSVIYYYPELMFILNITLETVSDNRVKLYTNIEKNNFYCNRIKELNILNSFGSDDNSYQFVIIDITFFFLSYPPPFKTLQHAFVI